MLDKAFIRSIVLFSFTTLHATDLDKVNRITHSTYLSRRFHSSSFIVSNFVPQKRQKQLLPIRRKNLFCFYLLSHTLIISLKSGNTLLSLGYLFSLYAAPSRLLLAALYILLCGTFFFLCDTPLLLLSHLCGTLILAFISKSAAPHES